MQTKLIFLTLTNISYAITIALFCLLLGLEARCRGDHAVAIVGFVGGALNIVSAIFGVCSLIL